MGNGSSEKVPTNLAHGTYRNSMNKRKNTSKNWLLIIGGVITALMFVIVIIGQFYTPYDPNFMDGSARLDPPSWAHIMGTDNFGRDIFSRVIEGSGMTLTIALVVIIIGASIGIIIGALSGYYGGFFDTVLMRVCDVITAFPSIMLALVIIAILSPSEQNIIWCLSILFIPSFARVTRSEMVKQRNQNYVKLAKLMGASNFRIIFKHILPNMIPVLLPAITIGFNNAVLAEASMSFLGVGVSANKSSLGRMLSESQNFLVGGAPWYALAVGSAIVLLILGLSLLGEGLQQKRRNR